MERGEIILGIVLSTATSILATLILQRLRKRAKQGLQFCIGDLTDPNGLVIKLGDSQNSVSQYIWWRIPDDAQPLVKKYDGSSPPPQSLLRSLIGVLNQLLTDQFLFDEQRFEKVPLTKETQKLIALGPQDDDIPSLNRLLLEDAYSSEIVQRRINRCLSFDARIVAAIVSIFIFVIILSIGIPGFEVRSETDVQDSPRIPRGGRDGPLDRPSPSPTSTIGGSNKLVVIIEQQQRVYVGESSGLEAPDNFTTVRLDLFIRNGTVDEIVESLKVDPEFRKVVEDIRAMPPQERETVLREGGVAYSKTWEQLNLDPIIDTPEDLRRGQTRAGQTAQRMIAEGIVNLVRSLL